jgi:hypothetical protein
MTQPMSEYDSILEKAREVAEQFKSTAKEFIPKMYKALRNENPNISAEDARDRIEKDCVGIWSKRTILEALPDEAKNQGKQKAGRLRQNKQNSAAFSAAPSPQQEEKKQKIIVANIQGKSVEEDIPLPSDLSESNSSLFEDNAANANSTQAGLEKKITVSELMECSNCQELHAEVIELRDALTKATPLTTADQINQRSSPGNSIQLENISSNISEFEFSLPLESVRQYIIRTFNVYKIKDKIWFSGTFDRSTGKVLTACTGRKSQQSVIGHSNEDNIGKGQ